MHIQNFRSIAVLSNLFFISGCVGYAPPPPAYPHYVAPPPVMAPYGGYPAARPMYAPRQEYRDYGQYREHEHEEHEHEHEYR